MAIARLKKVAIVAHKEEEEQLLPQLQVAGILHITRRGEGVRQLDLNRIAERDAVGSAIEYLSAFSARRGLIESFITTRQKVEPEEYARVVREFDLSRLRGEVGWLEHRSSELDAEEKRLRAELELISPWLPISDPLDLLYGLKSVYPEFGSLPDPQTLERVISRLEGLPVYLKPISQPNRRPHCLCLIPTDLVAQVKPILASHHWEPVDLSRFKGRPYEIAERIESQLTHVAEERAQILARAQGLVHQLPALKLFYDHCQGILDRDAARRDLFHTEHALIVEGWVRAKDWKRLKAIVEGVPHATIVEIAPEAGEQPPVALENRRWARPFELILDLFSTPQPWELDPTSLLAPFVALFFGLCLTDAGYGLVLIILALLLKRKIRGRLLDIFVIAGGVTVLTGVATGGWFGDLPLRLGLGFLSDLRTAMLIFDPFQNPMPFFYLSLGLGFLQLNLGILIEVYDSLRQHRYASAIFEHLSWFILLQSILGLIGAKLGYLPGNLSGLFLFAVAAWFWAGLFYVSLLQTTGSSLDRLLRGFYRVYEGISFLGNILSYMRLMALGMVTGGIGMAINILAGMVLNIPIVGVVIAPVILIFGHSFNLAISCLGGVVHTLRLQYVEFFPRFFTGGGQRFRPFQFQPRYIELLRQGG